MNKKLLKSFFAVVLAFAGLIAISHYASAAVKGDVNGDGECTASDVTALYNAILYNDYSKIVNGDQNGDGTVTASDVTAVYNIILGLAPKYETVYILGNQYEWDPTTGQEMETEDGVTYTATVEAKDLSEGYCWLGFTTMLADATSETPWEDIEAYRFGPVSEDEFLITSDILGKEISLTKEAHNTIKIPAGKYEFTMNLEQMTLVITKVDEPQPETQVWILGEVNGNVWNPAVGVEMTSEDGNIFTAQVTTKESGFSYFSFTKKLANPETDANAAWEEIAPYRFGAVGEDMNFALTEDLLGTNIALTTEGYLALQVAPGTFNLSIDLEKMELTVTGEFTPQQQPETSNWYLIGTNNSWSTTDKSYQFTQSTEDENVYSIHVDNVSGDFWFKIANEDCYSAADFYNGGTILSAANNGESALSGNLVQGNQGAFCIPASYKATYLDITINVAELTYSIETDGKEPVVDPDAEYDYMYIAGDADGWNGNGGKVASIKGAKDFYGFFNAGTKFKFQKDQGSWAVNYGGTNGTLASDGADIAASGYVYVNANLNNMTYSVTNITSMGVIGDATAGGWESETALTYNAETDTWEGDITFTAGEFKFRANNSWDIFDLGGSLDNLVTQGANIAVEAGTYKVVLKLVCPGEYTATLTPAN